MSNGPIVLRRPCFLAVFHPLGILKIVPLPLLQSSLIIHGKSLRETSKLELSVAKSLAQYLFLAVGLYLVPSLAGGNFVNDGWARQ